MTLRDFLKESKEMLDVSILAAKKYLTSDKKKEWFLTTPVTITAKTDGVKLTIVKKANNGDINDYIFAYKGNILYPQEYGYVSTFKTKKESVGTSQFKLVFEHFSKLGKTSIPVSTELFVEFLMKKSTLSSNYKRPHGMVLIASSKCTYAEKFGKLKTSSDFSTTNREKYAKELKLNVPLNLFKGVMGSELTFGKGILNKTLAGIFTQEKTSMNWSNYDNIISGLSRMLLKVESAFGGVEEGVVMTFNDGKLLKFQQEFQVDQAARAKIKLAYRDTPENETLYWKNVNLAAEELLKLIPNKLLTPLKLPDALGELAKDLKSYKPRFTHSKKTVTNIKDDIQLTTKTMIVKALKGNNNALFFGKYRVLTKAHYNIIKRGLSLYDDVVVGLITAGDTKATKDLREKMLRKAFPNIELIHASTGNIVRLLAKSPINVNVIIAGSDRVQSYREQLARTAISVKEIPRINDDISASKVIENIDDEKFFNKNTPKQIHDMYQELLKTYGDK